LAKKKVFTKTKKDAMAMAGSVENEIMKRYKVGGAGSGHATRDLYLIDTGILDLNMALGTNGLLGGRMSMIWGGRGSAKTMVMLCIIAQVQRDGGNAAFIDAEGTFDVKFAKMLGVDVDNLFLVSAQEKRVDDKGKRLLPLSGEEFYDMVNLLIYSGKYHYIGLDSITACVPHAMLSKPTVDQAALKAAQAIMNSLMLQKTNSFLTMAPHCHFMMISQERDQPMQMGPTQGKPSGGKAPGFYISYEIQAKKTETHRQKLPIAEGISLTIEQDIGIDLQLKITKNKVARIFEPAEIYVDLRTGVSQEADTVKTAKRIGVLEQKSSHYYYGEWSWNGEAAVIESLRESKELYEHMRKACISTLGIEYTDLTNAEGDDVAGYGSGEFDKQLEEFKEDVEPEFISEEEIVARGPGDYPK
jgi:recombination protein RecA